jgi:hypothetical protein
MKIRSKPEQIGVWMWIRYRLWKGDYILNNWRGAAIDIIEAQQGSL